MTWAAVGTAAAVGAGIGGVSAAIQGNDILTGALMGGATGALTGGAGSLASSAGTSAATGLTTEAASQLAPELLNTAAINAVPLDTVIQQVVPAGIEQITPEMINAVNQGSADAIAAQGTGVQSAGINNIGYTPSAAPPAPVPTPTPGPFVQSNTGLNVLPGEAGTAPASNGFMQGFTQFAKDNPFLTGAGIYTVASTTGMLDQNYGQQQPEEEETYTGPRLSANFQGGPYSPPNVYKPRYAEGGILQAYQTGGPVERMSQMNTAINPQGGLYPQGMIDKTQYALPTQRPTSMEVIDAGAQRTFAEGGIASVPRYYRGKLATSSGGRGDVYSATQRFLDMYDPQSRYQAPTEKGDPGIFRDTSAATRNKSAFDAAMTRQAALEKQSNVDTGAKLPRANRSAGQLNMKPQGKKAEKDEEYEYAASGGIMGANLGGYAAGGNPRLLKGPGDGMSDNIPAIIGRRQPARLADGEFVVPADVVSHLGNGSTDAGAKKLHGMMDNVRKARTGKKKQAPAVKTSRFIPK
jgi:hypothetical protein